MSVCWSNGSRAKMVERIEMLFGMWTHGCPRSDVLNGGLNPPWAILGHHLPDGLAAMQPFTVSSAVACCCYCSFIG